MKRAGSASVILAAAVLVGCVAGGEDQQARDDPAGGRLVTQVSFPLTGTDLRIRASVEGDTDLRRLTGAIAGLQGVAASEADYSERRVGVVLDEDLDDSTRSAVVERIAAIPGVESVTSLP
jgi:hypothetical protein